MADARKKTTKPTGGRQPSARDRKRGYPAAEKAAKDIEKLTPGERRTRLAELMKYLINVAPALAVAESDPLKVLMLIGAEFVAQYYPDATGASFNVHHYRLDSSGGADWHVNLPVPVPAVAPTPVTAENLKAAVRAYCDQHLPDWRTAMVHLPSVSARVGDITDFNDESLLVTPEK